MSLITQKHGETFDNLPLETLAVVANESAEAAANAFKKTVEHAIRYALRASTERGKVANGAWQLAAMAEGEFRPFGRYCSALDEVGGKFRARSEFGGSTLDSSSAAADR